MNKHLEAIRPFVTKEQIEQGIRNRQLYVEQILTAMEQVHPFARQLKVTQAMIETIGV